MKQSISVQIYKLSVIERYHILMFDMYPKRDMRQKLVFPCKDTSVQKTSPKKHFLRHAKFSKKEVDT